jgi:hypothetical protein
LNLPGVVLCPPIVCNPAFSPSAGRQEISGSSEEQPEVVTETPEGSNHGNIGNDTFCYWGPGSGYPTVNALQYGTEVQIIGIGAVQSWLVIDSPAYPGVPCWVAGEDVFPDPGFDPSAFPVIPIPVVELELPDGNGQSGEEHVEGPEDCDPETEYWSEKAQACETLY